MPDQFCLSSATRRLESGKACRSQLRYQEKVLRICHGPCLRRCGRRWRRRKRAREKEDVQIMGISTGPRAGRAAEKGREKGSQGRAISVVAAAKPATRSPTAGTEKKHATIAAKWGISKEYAPRRPKSTLPKSHHQPVQHPQSQEIRPSSYLGPA